MARSFYGAVSIVLCSCMLFLPRLLAQTNSPVPQYPANRFLLVVETSKTMQRRAEAMTRAVRDLFNSALAGQARRGDSIGVWTFNEELYAGLLPLQQWSPDSQKAITDRIAGFISAQKLEKRARFEKVLPALDRVVRNSPFITIIVVCLGDEEIHGTPFDQRINDFFRTWHLQPQDAGTPFVIAMRAQNGKFVDCTLNPSPWPAELPALPKELLTPLRPARTIAKELPKPATSSVPPLIISGKKRPASPELKTETTTTNVVVGSTSPATPIPAETNSITRAPATVSSSTVNGTPAPAGIQPTPLATVPQTPAPQAPISAPGSPPQPLTTPESNPAPTPKPETRTASQSGASVESSPEASQSKSASQNALATPLKPGSLGQQAVPVQMASASAHPAQTNPVIKWGLGVISVSALVGAIWVWGRRSRSRKEISLITESIHRDKSQ